MIRAPVQSRWVLKSGALLRASAERQVLTACPVLSVAHSGHSLISPPWIAHKSPPTCSGSGCQLQGQMEPAKRSHPAVDLNHGTHRAVPSHNQLFHWHSLTNNYYQAVHSVSLVTDARFPASGGTNTRRKVRVKKTRVGQLLEANPVVRLGQRQARPRGKQGSTSSDRQIQEEFELDHENIDIHSVEGALHDSLPNDEEMNEALSSARRQMNLRKSELSTTEQFGDSDASNLNEFDRQYFADAAKMKYQSFTSQSRAGVTDAKQNLDVDLKEGNEFDQQYFGSWNAHKSSPGVTAIGEMKDTNQSRPKKPVFMDTSAPENLQEITDYGLSTKEALKDFDKQLGQLFEDAGQDKSINIQSLFQFEPHEKATEFQRFEDENDHKDLTFDTEKQVGKKRLEEVLSRPLKAKLEAERIIQESKEELRIGNHPLSDLEPEIIKAMKAVRQAKTQRQSKAKTSKSRIQEGQKVYGTPNPSLPATDISCSGCGAQIQGNNPRLPGFLPSEKYQELLADDSLSKAVCQRCWYLTHKQMALDVSIGENDYEDIITKIRKKRALVVVLVDLLDFPCSLIPDLKVMVGEKKPMIIVGNKADLLPKDSSDCHNRIKKQLLEACVDAGVCNEENVKHVCIVSAKSGFGIEGLITALQKKWGTADDVYLLGTANVGKSSLFNRLLQSDYAKAKAAWLISKATISRWPGTTLNLLRFPIVKPTGEKLALRLERLSEEAKRANAEEERKKIQVGEDSVLDHEAYVKGSVGRSYEIVTKADDEDERALDDSGDPFILAVDKWKQSTPPQPKPKRSGKEDVPFRFRQEEFALGTWFYDTPGLIHDQQILTKLTVDELKLVIPKKGILPKTIILKPGNTVFLAGMGRIDYLEGHKAAFFTFFASKVLPLRVTTTAEADDYYQTMANTNCLKVPLGGPERMQTLPPLKPVDMNVTGVGWKCSAADVLFSSAGWAAVTGADGMEMNLRAYTPGGYGCLLRRPALLPYVVNLRGDRMHKKSPFFKLDKQKLMRYL